jgi:DNA (cytosine-5)-methyltransferase 1
MLTPQFLLPIHGEITVDLFAGGGGASTGIEQAIGRPVDVAINHDPEAVSLHQVNHPQTRHYVSDVFAADPATVAQGRPIGLLWASPDCTYHSKARGGKPHRDRNKARRRRALAWVVVRWAKLPAGQRPRVIGMENVEEWVQWGPLLEDGQPCPDRRGQSFQRWKKQLENLGYVVEHRELRGCDYGAPTIRKRLFLIARCDGQPIVWPEPTHGAPDSLPVRAKKLKPWAVAADCIDWSLPAPSIFERTRPLAEATMRRIAKGVMRYVVNAAEPFIVGLAHGDHAERAGNRSHGIREPLRTVHAGGGNHAMVAPTLVGIDNGSSTSGSWSATDPLRTTTTENRHALVTAFLAQYNNHQGTIPSAGRPANAPISTITTSGAQQQVVSAALVGVGARAGQSRPRGMVEPVATITGKADVALAAAHLVKLRGTCKDGQPATEPLGTVSAGGTHFGEVCAFLTAYYGVDQDPGMREPMHTVTTKDRFGLVMVKGQPYAIVDIGLRMLTPRELYNAQGFPASYIIERGADGRALTKTAQVRMCGNSVCPPLARAIVAANYSEQRTLRAVA